LLADCYNILNSWKNYACQLFNVHDISDVRQTEMHTAEPVVPGPNSFKAEITIVKLQKCKSLGNDQIVVELIQAGGNTLHSQINTLINCIWNKEELPQQWKESVIVPAYIKGNKTDRSNCRGISLLQTMDNILCNILVSWLTPLQMKLLGITSMDFDIIDQLLMRYSIFIKYWRKSGSIMGQYISYL
jgi:hypothetical protein